MDEYIQFNQTNRQQYVIYDSQRGNVSLACPNRENGPTVRLTVSELPSGLRYNYVYHWILRFETERLRRYLPGKLPRRISETVTPCTHWNV